MSFQAMTASFPWSRYSKKLINKIEKPHNVGHFDPEESEKRGMRLVVGSEGSVADGNRVDLFWLVDREDGTIVDARFQVWGQSALIGAAEIACDLLVGKNYDQANRIGADLIDKQAQDTSDEAGFPPETAPHLNLVLDAIEQAAEGCRDIPLRANYLAPPAPTELGDIVRGGYPGWESLTKKQKISVIEEVLNTEIRPYISLDGGGVTLLDLVDGREVLIAYQGNCTSCFSAVGATLSFIQQVVQGKVHPDLVVIPDLNS